MRVCFGKVSLFVLLTLLPALVTAQWLETTIYIPDSLCGIDNPHAFTYNPTNNKIYVGGVGSGVIVIDGETNEKVAKIPAGLCILSLCYNPTHNKVYCTNYRSNTVTVIDGATDSVITTIAVGDYPRALVYNSTHNKVYCANNGSDNVTVIDGATDSVITTITVGNYPRAFAWNPVQNRTYVANYYSQSVSVIRDSTTGIEEDHTDVRQYHFGATIFSGPLLLPRGKKCRVFDITGRTVAPDKIKAGIYFIEIDGQITIKVVKVR